MKLEPELLMLKPWAALGGQERESLARQIEKQLPSPFRFIGVEHHSQGDQAHHVAFYDWKGIRFAFIPGCQATLGYDRRNPFVPNEAQVRAWQDTQEEFGVDFDRYWDYCLT